MLMTAPDYNVWKNKSSNFHKPSLIIETQYLCITHKTGIKETDNNGMACAHSTLIAIDYVNSDTL